MNCLKWIQGARLSFLLLACMASAGSMAAMPSGEYACQVTVTGGRIGLVLVQADTRGLAEKAARGAQAITADKNPGQAINVIECIRRGEERFSDYQFQEFYKTVPL